MRILGIFLSIAAFCTSNPRLFGRDVRLVERIPLSQEKEIIQSAGAIGIIKNGAIVICDGRAGDLKIFDAAGRLAKVFGRRGDGPDEFGEPALCDYSDSRLLINDWDKDRIFIYDVSDSLEFRLSEASFGMYFDAKLNGKNLLLTGPEADRSGRWYGVYSQLSGKNEYAYYITFEELFGLPPADSGYSNKAKELLNLGSRFYCDYSGEYVYAAWEGFLSIIRVHIPSMTRMRFGKKTPPYKKPELTKRLIQAKRERNLKNYYRELHRFSMVLKVIATDEFVGLIYMNYDPDRSMLVPALQMYTPDGVFLSETRLDEAAYEHHLMPMFFDKKSHALYALSQKYDEGDEPQYTVLKYRIGL